MHIVEIKDMETIAIIRMVFEKGDTFFNLQTNIAPNKAIKREEKIKILQGNCIVPHISCRYSQGKNLLVSSNANTAKAKSTFIL